MRTTRGDVSACRAAAARRVRAPRRWRACRPVRSRALPCAARVLALHVRQHARVGGAARGGQRAGEAAAEPDLPAPWQAHREEEPARSSPVCAPKIKCKTREKKTFVGDAVESTTCRHYVRRALIYRLGVCAMLAAGAARRRRGRGQGAHCLPSMCALGRISACRSTAGCVSTA